MKREDLNRVKATLLQELDATLQSQYHQALNEVINDLRVRYMNIRPGSKADDIFSILLSTGILKNYTSSPVVEMRESIERLMSGAFGQCSVCGKEIPAEVLVRHPTARRCAHCESQMWALKAGTTDHRGSV
jgi:RNA polymerase-binding transcription factor DksA